MFFWYFLQVVYFFKFFGMGVENVIFSLMTVVVETLYYDFA